MNHERKQRLVSVSCQLSRRSRSGLASVLQSEVCHELCQGEPFAAAYWDEADGTRRWSLRSSETDGVDVSEIAKLYGGGGHVHAAGFRETK